MQILGQLRARGITLLIAIHDLNQAAEYFSTILLLNRRVIAFGPPDRVLTAQTLGAAYGNQLHVVHGQDGDFMVTDTCCGGGTPPVETLLGQQASAVNGVNRATAAGSKAESVQSWQD